MAVEYRFCENGEFILEDYDKAKTFAGFLPGIAGIHGIPMWSFYVNRGQALGSFGVRDKDTTIMEFFPANAMCRNIERLGFRTFIRRNGKVHELFSSISAGDAQRSLVVEKNVLQISETNQALRLKATVTYFTMPGENYAAIVRTVAVEDLGTQGNEIEILDGLAQILPFGVSNSGYQAISNLIKSWFDVTNVENNIAYYKVRATTDDAVEVREIHAGNFHLCFSSESAGLLRPIYDMDLIFGANTALSRADGWTGTLEELYRRKQVPQNKVSGGFAGAKTDLRKPFTLYTVIGHAASAGLINGKAAAFTPAFIQKKLAEARLLAEGLVEGAGTVTANRVFDWYIGQCALDNVIRGGYPLLFKAGGRNHVYHIYSRKHGDLEREYNFFSLEPEFYSQGNGNYRDVNQNRRNDVLLHPDITDFNVRHFMSLIQADGYNPLLVKGCSFTVPPGAMDGLLQLLRSHRDETGSLLSGTFTPGRLTAFLAEHAVELTVSGEAFLEKALACAEQHFEAEFGEGYWSDHWTYNMDLVDSFLAVYPDRKEEFLFGNGTYRFFHSGVRVLPRADKYVLVQGEVRQYGAVQTTNARKGTGWLKTGHGAGRAYETTLFAKLVSLALIKFASLDPCGIGIEMEAGRPGWNDALNGLPGLFGSGVGETAELRRVIDFLTGACQEFDRIVPLYAEAAGLLEGVAGLLARSLSGELCDFDYWDRVSCLKEGYRNSIRLGIGGEERALGTKELLPIFRDFIKKLDAGLNKAMEMGGGIPVTYCTYRAARYEILEDGPPLPDGCPRVKVTAFDCKPMPLFLEAPARMLKLMPRGDGAERLHNAVKASAIYDRKLKMYKTSAPLTGAGHEIGRLAAFTPGWLERESVFLHMEYKYLYAMLKAGLYGPFFEDMKTTLIPFLEPETYGRSTLENSSFIASSANPDETLHGRGFVARLSGSTAEMLSMWFMMMAGSEVFTWAKGALSLKLNPILPGWLFGDDGRIHFRFLGHTTVTYINPERHNTYGPGGARPTGFTLATRRHGAVRLEGSVIGAPWAEAVRAGEVTGIDVYLQ